MLVKIVPHNQPVYFHYDRDQELDRSKVIMREHAIKSPDVIVQVALGWLISKILVCNAKREFLNV